jgi:hypothetical protein
LARTSARSAGLGRVHGDAHGRNLKVIADPGQQLEPFLLGDLFG